MTDLTPPPVSLGWLPDLPSEIRRAFLEETIPEVANFFKRHGHIAPPPSRFQLAAGIAGRAVVSTALDRAVHRIEITPSCGCFEGAMYGAVAPPISSRSRPEDDLTLVRLLLASEAGERRLIGAGITSSSARGDAVLARVVGFVASSKLRADPRRLLEEQQELVEGILKIEGDIHENIATALYFLSNLSGANLAGLLAKVQFGAASVRQLVRPDPFDPEPGW